MNLIQATQIAENLKNYLIPACERIEIAGSIRRKKPEVKDIEVVLIPKVSEGWGTWARQELIARLQKIEAASGSKKLKGDPKTGQYIQYHLGKYKINLDIFVAEHKTWGLDYLLRTGPTHFNIRTLQMLEQNDIHSIQGRLYRRGHVIEAPEEHTVFEAAGMKYIDPEWRHLI